MKIWDSVYIYNILQSPLKPLGFKKPSPVAQSLKLVLTTLVCLLQLTTQTTKVPKMHFTAGLPGKLVWRHSHLLRFWNIAWSPPWRMVWPTSENSYFIVSYSEYSPSQVPIFIQWSFFWWVEAFCWWRMESYNSLGGIIIWLAFFAQNYIFVLRYIINYTSDWFNKVISSQVFLSLLWLKSTRYEMAVNMNI